MFAVKPYQRLHAVAYARRWALARNPLFRDFGKFGGDCTSFASQCLLAGSCEMNDRPIFGWYYRMSGEYAPAWTGVPYFYNFLTENMENGPAAEETDADRLMQGDFIQLGNRDGFYHTLVAVGRQNGTILVCAHDRDSRDRPLSDYSFSQMRCLHVTGVRFSVPDGDACFAGLMAGTSETGASAAETQVQGAAPDENPVLPGKRIPCQTDDGFFEERDGQGD